jgi:hypothetical protein
MPRLPGNGDRQLCAGGISGFAMSIVPPAQPSRKIREVVWRVGVLHHEQRHAEPDQLICDSRVGRAVDGGRPLDRGRVPADLHAPAVQDLALAAQPVARRVAVPDVGVLGHHPQRDPLSLTADEDRYPPDGWRIEPVKP